MTDTVAGVLRGRQSPRVEFREGDAQIDITVEIAADRLDQDLFDVLVTSPHLPEFDNAAPERWKLPTKAASLVTEYMADLTDTALEPGQLRARIIGVGKRLYAVAPPRFHEVYWRLTDRGRPPRTILVQSEEWAIPWELMVPSRLGRAGERVTQPPLGFQLALGRWLANDGHAPLQLVDLDDSYVFAPKYPRRMRLRHAQEEVKLVCDAFSGTAVKPGRQSALDHALAERSVSLLHFTCHGEVRSPPIQAILLENDGRMISYELSGMDGLAQAVQDKRPMVFLNACEVGRLAPSLIGVGGFAKEFIDLGARCVIAPLWSVTHDVAFDVARRFYTRIKHDPAVRFADVMSEIRGLSFERDADSYAAYAFYGDPLSCRADFVK